jgi:hypothetical protein
MTTSTSIPVLTPTASAIRATSRGKLWTGRVMTSIAVLFLLMDAIAKLVKPAPVVQGTLELGYPETVIVGLGIVLLASAILYALPRTAVLGAILLTGYLGGAVATHVRVGHPVFSHILFPVYVGILIWGGLVLRDERVQKLLLPFRR